MKDCKHGQVRENKRYLTLGSTKRGKPCLWDPVKESGMLLVTGPTGSGKTCLLAMLATQTLTNGGRVFYTSLAKDSDFPDAVLRHCDSVTSMGDFAGVVDHLERLCDELEQRAALVVEHHTDSIYKIDESMVSAGEQHLIAPVTVIIDDFDYLFQWWHTHPEEYARKLDVYRLMGSLAALVGRGCLLGIRLAMAAQHFTIDDMVSVPPYRSCPAVRRRSADTSFATLARGLLLPLCQTVRHPPARLFRRRTTGGYARRPPTKTTGGHKWQTRPAVHRR